MNDKLTKLTKALATNVSLDDFKVALEELEKEGLDPKYVDIEDEDGYNFDSLLNSCLLNPTDENFEIFKYLIEEGKVKIEDNIKAEDLRMDFQKAPPNTEKIKKFLNYIDTHTDIEQKNKCKLFNLSIFFNDVDLFKKLLNNKDIRIDSTGQRGDTPIRGIGMSSHRPEILKLFLENDRCVEKETGALVVGTLYQLAMFQSNEIIETAISKFKDYSNFDAVVNTDLKAVMSTIDLYPIIPRQPEQEKQYAIIKENILTMYNTGRINTSEVMTSKEFIDYSLCATPESENRSNINMIIFLSNPGIIDIVTTNIYSKANQDIPKDLNIRKLAYVLECVRDLKGIEGFFKIASTEHNNLFKTFNNLSPKELCSLAITLGIKSEKEIDGFCDKLKSMCIIGDRTMQPIVDISTQLGIDKFKGAMLEETMNPIIRFFDRLFNNPSKLFGKHIDALDPITLLQKLKGHNMLPQVVDEIAKGTEVLYGKKSYSQKSFSEKSSGQEKIQPTITKSEVEMSGASPGAWEKRVMENTTSADISVK